MKKCRFLLAAVSVVVSAALAGCSRDASQEIVPAAAVETEYGSESSSEKKAETKQKTGKGNTAVVKAQETEKKTSARTDAAAETEVTASEEPEITTDLTAYHPTVRIVTEDPVDSKENYVKGTISVEGTADQFLLSDVPLKIRIRGNASAVNTETPPYRIKFNEKNNLLGLHDGKTFKSWVLLNFNSGICANYLTLHLGQAIYGENYWMSDSTLTKLYLNGKYMGIYTAAEQNQIKKNRVNVHEAATGDEKPDDIGYLVEMDNYYETSDDPNFVMKWQDYPVTDMSGYTDTFGVKHCTVKNETVTADQLDFIDNYINNVFRLIHAATYDQTAYKFDRKYNLVEARIKPEQAVRNVIDVDSAVAIYLVEELTANRDQGNGSFFMAVDFSKDALYPKLTFTPAWDLTLCNMNFTEGYYTGKFIREKDGHETDNAWLIMLMCNDWFREEVAARVKELAQSGEIDQLLSDTSAYMHSYESEADHDAYMKEADARIAFYTSRYNWLKSEFLK